MNKEEGARENERKREREISIISNVRMISAILHT